MTRSPMLFAGLAAMTLGACERGPDTPPAPDPVPTPATTIPKPAPTTPAEAASAAARVPDAFQGEWNRVLADCGSGRNDSRLTIAAREVRFYEGGGPVTAVEAARPDAVALTLALSSEGEGPRDVTYRFRLSPDGQVLTDLAGGLERRRCPGQGTG